MEAISVIAGGQYQFGPIVQVIVHVAFGCAIEDELAQFQIIAEKMEVFGYDKEGMERWHRPNKTLRQMSILAIRRAKAFCEPIMGNHVHNVDESGGIFWECLVRSIMEHFRMHRHGDNHHHDWSY